MNDLRAHHNRPMGHTAGHRKDAPLPEVPRWPDCPDGEACTESDCGLSPAAHSGVSMAVVVAPHDGTGEP